MSRRLLFCSLFLTVPALAFDSIQLKKTIPAPAALKSSALTAIAADPTGRLWVTDPINHQVHLFSKEGDYVQSLGKRGSGPGEFLAPHGIAVGPDGLIYVADSGNQRIQI